MQKSGIATAQYFSSEPDEHPNEASLPIAIPFFVKPVSGGDSRGVDTKSIVNDFSSFLTKIA